MNYFYGGDRNILSRIEMPTGAQQRQRARAVQRMPSTEGRVTFLAETARHRRQPVIVVQRNYSHAFVARFSDRAATRSSGSSGTGRFTIKTIPKRTTSTTDGLQLAYWLGRAGSQGNRFLLLIHGAASNHTRWSEFVEHTALARNWNVILPDMRGNGASMTRRKLGMRTWCADLVDVLDAEDAPGAVVVGHSLGAQIAVHLAHRYPDRVRGLVLIDPVFQAALRGRQRIVRRCRWLLEGLAALIRAMNLMGVRRRHIRDRDLRELDEETRRAIAGAESFEEISKRYGALGPILRHMPVANYLRQALATVAPLPDPAAIHVPVQVLISGGTTLADFNVNRSEAARFPESEVVMLDANHWPLTETPDDVREAIEDWVGRTFGEPAGVPADRRS